MGIFCATDGNKNVNPVNATPHNTTSSLERFINCFDDNDVLFFPDYTSRIKSFGANAAKIESRLDMAAAKYLPKLVTQARWKSIDYPNWKDVTRVSFTLITSRDRNRRAFFCLWMLCVLNSFFKILNFFRWNIKYCSNL